MANSIGEQLKQARQQRGLTIEQASRTTHIRVSYLEALENDRREDLPSNVQGRGFLRLYAGLLDLPVAPLLAAWEGKPLLAEEPPVTELPENHPISAAAASPASESTLTVQAEVLPQVASTASVEEAPEEPLSGSRAIFHEIGQKLKQQRIQLGLSPAEVERFTHLRQFYISALEDGRLDDLPSPVQGRGMLSNYATFLNMDEERLLLRFADGLQARRIERLPAPEPRPIAGKRRPAQQAPFWRRFLTPDLIFGVGVAAIILFFVIWTAARITNLRSVEARPTPPAISQILLTQASAQTATPSPALTGSTDIAGAASGDQTTPPAEAAAPGINETVTPAGLPNSPAPTEEPTLLPANDDPLQVYIVAKQRAWLRITADDKIKFLGRVVPGNAYAFSGTQRIELLTGNAAGLQVFFNQKDWGTLGLPGQVVGLVFVPKGIYTPTAAFTPTGLPTKPATATPLPSPTLPATPTITPFIPK